MQVLLSERMLYNNIYCAIKNTSIFYSKWSVNVTNDSWVHWHCTTSVCICVVCIVTLHSTYNHENIKFTFKYSKIFRIFFLFVRVFNPNSWHFQKNCQIAIETSYCNQKRIYWIRDKICPFVRIIFNCVCANKSNFFLS